MHDKDLNGDHNGQFHGVASIFGFRSTKENKLQFNLIEIIFFIADTKSIVWTHTLCRTQVDKTDNTERSTRHWCRRNHRVRHFLQLHWRHNHRVTDTFL